MSTVSPRPQLTNRALSCENDRGQDRRAEEEKEGKRRTFIAMNSSRPMKRYVAALLGSTVG